MKKFIKENLVLVLGLTLPLLLVLLFFVATVLPKLFGMPPQHEMAYTTSNYVYQNKSDYVLDFKVNNQRLIVKASKQDNKNNNNYTEALFIYDGKTETVREIKVDASKLTDGVEVPVEEVKDMVIDISRTSPDGYTLEGPRYGHSGLIGGLFGGGYRDSEYRLVKGGVGYKLPNNQSRYYYDRLDFLGWNIKK